MKIKIAGIPEGVHEYSFSGAAKDIGLEEPFVGSYSLQVRVDRANHQIVVNGDIQLSGKFECDRCLDEFVMPIENSFTVTYIFGSDPGTIENEEELEDVFFIQPETDKISIHDEIYDYAHLAIPMRKVCSEDCKGLCPQCGSNRNHTVCECKNEEIDERWKPLLGLLNKNEKRIMDDSQEN